jgi:hypothetical protein
VYTYYIWDGWILQWILIPKWNTKVL